MAQSSGVVYTQWAAMPPLSHTPYWFSVWMGVRPWRSMLAWCSLRVSDTCTCMRWLWSWANWAIHCHRGAEEVYSPWMEASRRICPSPAPWNSSVRARWATQSPQVSGLKSAGSPKYTPPQDRLALMPAFKISWAMVEVNMYMSATQVTPEAIISARPSPAPACTARGSSLPSAGKM